MSSILKALKKLEDEIPKKGRSVVWPSGGSGRHKTMLRWEITSGRFTPILWGLLAAAVLVTVAFLVFYRQPASGPAPSPKTAVAPQPAPAESTKIATTAKQPAVKPVAPVQKVIPPQPERPAPQSRPPRPAVSPTAAEKSVPPPAKTPPPARAAAPDSAPPPKVELPVLSTDLKLQAISWAREPKNRIAVINGSIVREGGGMEGYAIVRIDEDQVVVRKGSDQWRLVFNLQ